MSIEGKLGFCLKCGFVKALAQIIESSYDRVTGHCSDCHEDSE